jgi:hypothetical protein
MHNNSNNETMVMVLWFASQASKMTSLKSKGNKPDWQGGR